MRGRKFHAKMVELSCPALQHAQLRKIIKPKLRRILLKWFAGFGRKDGCQPWGPRSHGIQPQPSSWNQEMSANHCGGVHHHTPSAHGKRDETKFRTAQNCTGHKGTKKQAWTLSQSWNIYSRAQARGSSAGATATQQRQEQQQQQQPQSAQTTTTTTTTTNTTNYGQNNQDLRLVWPVFPARRQGPGSL